MFSEDLGCTGGGGGGGGGGGVIVTYSAMFRVYVMGVTLPILPYHEKATLPIHVVPCSRSNTTSVTTTINYRGGGGRTTATSLLYISLAPLTIIYI